MVNIWCGGDFLLYLSMDSYGVLYGTPATYTGPHWRRYVVMEPLSLDNFIIGHWRKRLRFHWVDNSFFFSARVKIIITLLWSQASLRNWDIIYFYSTSSQRKNCRRVNLQNLNLWISECTLDSYILKKYFKQSQIQSKGLLKMQEWCSCRKIRDFVKLENF